MNQIKVVKEFSWREVVDLLKKAELHGDGKVLPYKQAKIETRVIKFDDVKPLSLYVLKKHIEFQKKLRKLMLSQLEIDTLDLNSVRGGLVYELEGEGRTWKMCPPIVEVSEFDGGQPVLLDGQHRFLVAKEFGLPIRVVWIENVSKDIPVIAKPVSWSQVEVMDRVLEVKAKRDFRYKNLSEIPDVSSFSNKKITKENMNYFFYRDLNSVTSSAVRKEGDE